MRFRAVRLPGPLYPLDGDAVEMRWSHKNYYIRARALYVVGGWKHLCAIARIAKKDFKAYLKEKGIE